MKVRFEIVLAATIVLVILTFIQVAAGQTIGGPTLVKIAPRNCEFNNMALELANSDAGPDSLLILIARLGIRDRHQRTLSRRLHTAKAYLVDYAKLRDSKTLVVAQASRDRRLFYGGIEIYVDGRLQDIITSDRDLDLAVGPCTSEPPNDKNVRRRLALLYPWIYKQSK